MDAESNPDPPRNGPGGDHLELSSSSSAAAAGGAGGRGAEGTPGGGAGSSTARYKTMSPASLPIARSPCLTIPPGLSPTTLLESPVLLSNIPLAEPSPTTGTFSFRPCNAGFNSGLVSNAFSSSWNVSKKHYLGDGSGPGSFVFKPREEASSSVGALAVVNSNPEKNQNFGQCQGYSEPQASIKIEAMAVSAKDLSLSVATSEAPACGAASNSITPANPSSDELNVRRGPDAETQHVSLDQKGAPLTVVERPSEDGYNWRKYGQKLVKGSEFPRSYYKCTHPNCQMKKKLERNHEGLVTAIIYEGVHDHPKPQPSRRLAVGASENAHGDDRSDRSTNIDDKSLNAIGQACNQLESNGTPELSSVSVSDDDEDVDGSGAHRDRNDEADEDDPEAKRRKLETVAMDSTITTRTTREPRVVVQTLSEVDILDDGYRWRKYGQKVVKGNPNPRSYYKCTNAGCPVRKHVERASHDPKSVITTYEGKHNHDVPTSSSTNRETSAPMAVQNLSPLNTNMQVSLNPVMLMPPNQIEVNRAVPYSRGPDAVSLDLGVGISQAAENSSLHKQNQAEADSMLRQVHGGNVPSSGINCPVQSAGILPFYGNGIMGNRPDHYRVKEEEGQNFNFDVMSSLNNFHRSTGRFMLGSEVDASHAQQFTR
ncbi:WRKY transcription factor SUSIBA2-like isoform X1 [Nymphaea colorata]|nr:WRKY transcription factor SUSIBA2-like isoform X1 [Nymphaea colorata]